MLKEFYVDENFWKANPDLAHIGEFKNIYKSDKSKDKGTSSTVMWAIALIWDLDSKYIKIQERDRIKLIATELLNNENFFDDTDKYTKAIEFYQYIQKDSAKRYLEEWDKKLDERREYIAELQYSEETWGQVDKMLLSSKKLLEDRNSIVEMINKESETRIKGNKQLTMMEKDELNGQ